LFREGIPNKNGVYDIKTLSLRDSIRQASLSRSDCEFIINELKRKELIRSCVYSEASDAVSLAEFLNEFWDFDRSLYIREILRAEHSFHRRYV